MAAFLESPLMGKESRDSQAGSSSHTDSNPDTTVDANSMPFGDHLEELRLRLIRALIGFVLCTVVSFIFAKDILAIILKPVTVAQQAHGEIPGLLALSPAGPFILYLKVGFFSGLILAMPWLLYQFWCFVHSGLYARERRFVNRLVPASTVLFATGVAFLFYIVLPIVLSFFIRFSQSFTIPDLQPSAREQLLLGTPAPKPAPNDVALDLNVPIVEADPVDPPNGSVWFNSQSNTLSVQTSEGVQTTPMGIRRSVRAQYGISDYVTMVFALALGFGLAFELPVVVVFLAALGLVSTTRMAAARRYVLLGIVIAAAILTPPDVISQILLAVPMYVLFEGGLIVARAFEHREPE